MKKADKYQHVKFEEYMCKLYESECIEEEKRRRKKRYLVSAKLKLNFHAVKENVRMQFHFKNRTKHLEREEFNRIRNAS